MHRGLALPPGSHMQSGLSQRPLVHFGKHSAYCSCCLRGCGTLDAHQKRVAIEREVFPPAFLLVLVLCSPSSSGSRPQRDPSPPLQGGWKVDALTRTGPRAGDAAPWDAAAVGLRPLRRGEDTGCHIPGDCCAIPWGSTAFSSNHSSHGLTCHGYYWTFSENN